MLRSNDGETLVQIQDIRIEYDWFACLQGVVAVEKCLIEKLQIATEVTADKEDPLVVWMGSFSGGGDSGYHPLRLRISFSRIVSGYTGREGMGSGSKEPIS